MIPIWRGRGVIGSKNKSDKINRNSLKNRNCEKKCRLACLWEFPQIILN
jgi:hypothetical protein